VLRFEPRAEEQGVWGVRGQIDRQIDFRNSGFEDFRILVELQDLEIFGFQDLADCKIFGFADFRIADQISKSK
jgi:hypothetical protein